MRKVIGSVLFLLILSSSQSFAERPLVFGAITTVKPELVRKRFAPLLRRLSQELGREVLFSAGRDYDDTIEKFLDGTFDLGYIGPSPYVLATRKDPKALRVVAGIETRHRPTFRAAIVTRKGSDIKSLKDLEGKDFAFGSRRSTLSYYLPYYMLLKSGVLERLHHYDTLGRHDIVAKNVIMGTYDAGGIKMSVADAYGRYLDKIAVSQPITDFAIVVHRSMDPQLAQKIRRILLEIHDPKILHSIKKKMTGFGPRKDADYDELRKIMKIVDRHSGYVY